MPTLTSRSHARPSIYKLTWVKLGWAYGLDWEWLGAFYELFELSIFPTSKLFEMNFKCVWLLGMIVTEPISLIIETKKYNP